jgi:hypothetical protein
MLDSRRMIKKLSSVFVCAVTLCLSGCATPRQTYLNQHPEVSAEHRRLMEAGVLVDRDPVAGMTREQIRLTMGTDPFQVTKINGEDAWVWVKPKRDSLTMVGETRRAKSPGAGSFSNMPGNDEPMPKARLVVRTTVFFRGDVATRVDVTEEPRDQS